MQRAQRSDENVRAPGDITKLELPVTGGGNNGDKLPGPSIEKRNADAGRPE